MKNKFGIKNDLKNYTVILAVIIFMSFGFLAMIPNYACGCGEVENGTKLTYYINGISKAVIGKKVFNSNK